MLGPLNGKGDNGVVGGPVGGGRSKFKSPLFVRRWTFALSTAGGRSDCRGQKMSRAMPFTSQAATKAKSHNIAGPVRSGRMALRGQRLDPRGWVLLERKRGRLLLGGLVQLATPDTEFHTLRAKWAVEWKYASLRGGRGRG